MVRLLLTQAACYRFSDANRDPMKPWQPNNPAAPGAARRLNLAREGKRKGLNAESNPALLPRVEVFSLDIPFYRTF